MHLGSQCLEPRRVQALDEDLFGGPELFEPLVRVEGTGILRTEENR